MNSRTPHAAPDDLVADLLAIWWAAGLGGIEGSDDTAVRMHLLLALRAAHIVTMQDVLAIDLDQLARLTGYSRRGFETFFRRAVGASPANWFMKVRLYGTWHDLRRPGARAADVARRWGFAHLGRFSAYYRDAYGEAPGDVLKRAGT